MATGGQGQPQQPTSPKKPPEGLRRALGIIGTLLILIGSVLSILATMKIITDMWGSISFIVLTGLTLLIALFTWRRPFSSDSPDTPQTVSQPSTSSNTAPISDMGLSAIPSPDPAPAYTVSPS
ncbi:MAG: hypothetical protein H0V70_07855 [Ktedonobacteraceae bacterium]|nr:hypothetical protein [Ktedonobacteraceae bacterium]